ncbi:MAG: hypothetical protein ACQEWW_26345 [Bacillota bacterium]
MTKKNIFDEPLDNEIPKKKNPHLNTKQEKFPHEKYQTVRIRPSDFKKLKDYAKFKDITMVDAISIAIDSLDTEAAKKEFIEKIGLDE